MNAMIGQAAGADARLAFESAARELGLAPRGAWVGGAPDYDWDHLRLMLEVLPLKLDGLRALEFGCNAGASAILLAHLGAQVSAVDVAADWIRLARLNAARYGIDDIEFIHVPDTRALPFADRQFDVVACNSALEYVARPDLAAVQREIDRVLAPGGLILLTGSGNRLWSRRGLWPWSARRGFGPHYDNLDTAHPNSFLARSRQGRALAPPRLKLLLRLAALLGVGPGMLTRHLVCLLQKRGASRRQRAGAAPPALADGSGGARMAEGGES